MKPMPMFELQILSDDRWKASGVFDNFDGARERAQWIERKRLPEQIRILSIEFLESGSSREKTMYVGGQKARQEKVAERKNEDQDAYRQRIADRRVQRTVAVKKIKVFSSSSPVYLTLMSLTIGLTGLSAMYLVERVFTS
jgi:hypothetical protein